MLGLTPAETEIAVLLAEGRTVRDIAATTGRGYSTVQTHLKHIFTKLGISRRGPGTRDVADPLLGFKNIVGSP